ncbi:MAG: GNAT family N-acetyltransferase [Bacteroidales bacterium]|nr:GNAT family N-acetyltransferase [Bacteroidales bacterium]
MFTLSNSSIDARNLPNNRRRKLTENIPHEKSLSTYPATLIGRLGVDKNFSGKGVGLELIKYIKQRMLLLSNIAACRYLTVDAYSNESALKFYEANGFKPLFSSDKQEKEYIGLPIDKELKTRLLYFDLIKLNNIKMDFIKVYGTGKLYEAELIVGLLSNNNIEATVINKRDSQYLFGEAEVHVAAADAEMAKEIISNRHE